MVESVSPNVSNKTYGFRKHSSITQTRPERWGYGNKVLPHRWVKVSVSSAFNCRNLFAVQFFIAFNQLCSTERLWSSSGLNEKYNLMSSAYWRLEMLVAACLWRITWAPKANPWGHHMAKQQCPTQVHLQTLTKSYLWEKTRTTLMQSQKYPSGDLACGLEGKMQRN